MICLWAAGALWASFAVDGFGLSWTHSVEKIEWREEWRVENGRLSVVEARVKGSGAGMEPPDGARLTDGWWVYVPDLAPLAEIVLARSDATADWRLCLGECRPLADWVPLEAGTTTIRPCG
ncbi:MAG: DUF1850 domain-containing protein [Alphaproteobacteria bacterium]|nr:DUF1850 domain-containing protein [Alphaproteobacteria bacterium]